MGKKIILAGSSGLIGSLATPLLVNAGYEVHIIIRREMAAIAGVTQHVEAPENWPQIVSVIGADIAVSCLGTTLRTAGSQAAFAAIDLDLVCAFARAAKTSGADRFIGVSSVGASAKSSNFYLKTKGEMENAVAEMGFAQTHMLHPGLLRGERGGSVRYGEQLGKILSPFTDMLLLGPLQRYRSIAAQDVAAAICTLAMKPGGQSGARTGVHENDAILALAKENR
jgi:uncharacterized protein YbjT (DUF2867 family)